MQILSVIMLSEDYTGVKKGGGGNLIKGLWMLKHQSVTFVWLDPTQSPADLTSKPVTEVVPHYCCDTGINTVVSTRSEGQITVWASPSWLRRSTVGLACYLGPGEDLALWFILTIMFTSSTFSPVVCLMVEGFRKDTNTRMSEYEWVLGIKIQREKEQNNGKRVFTQESGVYIYGWIHKVGWAWERSSQWMQHTLGSWDRPQGSQKAQESTEGG